MLRNYLLVALRNIRRHKLFAFINMAGLALSLSFCLLVIMMIVDQHSFDRFHPDGEDVYRVLTEAHRKNGDTEPYASTPAPLGPALAEQSPDVVATTTLSRGLNGEVVQGQSAIRVEGFFVSGSFFDVFGFPLEKGDPATVFSQPNGIVLTQATAEKLFGSQDPVGQRVVLSGMPEFFVTGVLQPFPGRTHLQFDALASSTALPLVEGRQGRLSVLDNWVNYYSSYTYVKRRAGSSQESLQRVMDAIATQQYANLDLETRDKGYAFHLQPLLNISPGPFLSNELSRSLPEPIILFITVLALVGIIAAVFNYTSLTLARSLTRAKEVGLRKVVGANRFQVFVQFVSESVVSAGFAFILASILLQAFLIPAFEQLSFMKDVDLDLSMRGPLFGWFAAFALGIGVLAGLLPAFVISRFSPSLIFRGLSKVKVFSALTPRMALVVFQFALSIVLMIVLTVSFRQIEFAMHPANGFNTENLLSIDLQGHDPSVLAADVRSQSAVRSVTAISHHMGTWEDGSVDVLTPSRTEPAIVKSYGADVNFVDHYGLSLVAGSSFEASSPSVNRDRVLVNETFVKQFELGAPQDAIGQTLTLENGEIVHIAGVMRDFIYKPLSYELAPVLVRYLPDQWRFLDVRVRAEDVDKTLAAFEQTWKTIDPVHQFRYKTYDDLFYDVYSNMRDLMVIVGFLGIMAVAIALLGLLGIVTYNAESRVKEVGIRKVLGADARSVVYLLAKSEIIMLAIATVIGIPASVWLSGVFLEFFAYRIPVGPSVILPGLLAVYAVSALTVVIQAVRTTNIRLVEVLRYE